jgi:hypothetical protein
MSLKLLQNLNFVLCVNHVVNGVFDFNVVDHNFFGEVCLVLQCLFV